MTTCSFIRADSARLIARNTTLLYTEICAIQTAILTAINNGEYSTTVSNNTPMTSINNIASVTVTDGGSDYFPVTATATVSSSSGSNAVLVPVVAGQTITDFTISNGGSGYVASNTSLSVSHPTGVGFVGQLVISAGVIVGVDIDEGGNLYNPLLPTAFIVSTSGVDAELSVQINSGTGVITGITVVEGGYGYSQDATVTITPAPTSSGDDATATVTVNFSAAGLTAPQYYAVVSGQSSDRVITDQLQFVQDYFTSLGYNIRPQVNPITSNTLQWLISW